MTVNTQPRHTEVLICISVFICTLKVVLYVVHINYKIIVNTINSVFFMSIVIVVSSGAHYHTHWIGFRIV